MYLHQSNEGATHAISLVFSIFHSLGSIHTWRSVKLDRVKNCKPSRSFENDSDDVP